LARVSGFSVSYGIPSCGHRLCGLLAIAASSGKPCGPVSLPPALYKAPRPCVEVCWCCLLTEAYELKSKPVSSCWYLSCCRPQLNSHHISLGCKSSLQEAFSPLGKACIPLMMKEMSLSTVPLGLLDCNCMESICVLVATSPYQSFILSVDIVLHACLLFYSHCSMCVLGVSLVLVY